MYCVMDLDLSLFQAHPEVELLLGGALNGDQVGTAVHRLRNGTFGMLRHSQGLSDGSSLSSGRRAEI
jgi:hypothetical protein